METLNAIIDLARSLEPATPNPQFEFLLRYDPKTNEWTTKIQLHSCWLDVTGKTAEEAVQKLHDDLLGMNKNIMQKIYTRITRWAKKTISPL